MGLMELELARMEHRLRTAEVEQRNSMLRLTRERKRGNRPPQGEEGQEQAKADWPLITLRFGPFQLALLRTVRLPSGRWAQHSHGTSSPGE